MSLDTLLEAAKYLDHIQKTDSDDGIAYECVVSDGTDDTQEALPSSTYHLKLDPNLPISVQFHNYTGLIPVMANTDVWNSRSDKSTKHGGHAMAANNVIGSATDSWTVRPAIRENNENSRTRRHQRDGSEQNKDHSSYSRHREMHKTLEKNRRAHLRHCFEALKKELPANEYNEKKSSHINIISCAIRYIQHLKRTETELHRQAQRLSRAKNRFQSQMEQLMQDLRDDGIHYEDSSDQQSEEDVIIELRTEENQCYEDETTNTASECADDISCQPPNPPKAMSQSMVNSLIFVGHV